MEKFPQPESQPQPKSIEEEIASKKIKLSNAPVAQMQGILQEIRDLEHQQNEANSIKDLEESNKNESTRRREISDHLSNIVTSKRTSLVDSGSSLENIVNDIIEIESLKLPIEDGFSTEELPVAVARVFLHSQDKDPQIRELLAAELRRIVKNINDDVSERDGVSNIPENVLSDEVNRVAEMEFENVSDDVHDLIVKYSLTDYFSGVDIKQYLEQLYSN
jgi:hypothetical protein